MCSLIRGYFDSFRLLWCEEVALFGLRWITIASGIKGAELGRLDGWSRLRRQMTGTVLLELWL